MDVLTSAMIIFSALAANRVGSDAGSEQALYWFVSFDLDPLEMGEAANSEDVTGRT